MKKIILLLIALVAILFLWFFFSEEEPPLPKKFSESPYYEQYNLADKFVIYVDFARLSKKRRLWVVDKGVVLATSYTSHGKKSAAFTNFLAPRRFSNKIRSNQSSLGLFQINSQINMGSPKKHDCSCDDYMEKSKCSHWPKAFILIGKSESNSNAKARELLIHTANYVSEKGCTGNSNGCFVVSPEIFELLHHKRLLFLNKKCYLIAMQ
jgi:hypothetical protein